MVFTLIAAGFVLSVLIFTHELGHFSAAKLLGVRVIRFSLGLGPRLVGFKKGETDYAISIIPFGGYVKMAGTEDDEGEKKDYEFTSKSTAAKIWIILSWPLANLVLAFFIYVIISSSIGTAVLNATKVGYVEPGSAAFEAGIKEGDQILMVGNKTVSNWNEIVEEIASQSRGSSLKIRRGAEELWFMMEPSEEPGIAPLIEPVVGRVQRGSPADKAGLKEGDRIVAINNTKVQKWEDIIDKVQASPDVSLQIDWVRAGQVHTATLVPRSEVDVQGGKGERIGMIGIYISISRVKLPFFSAVAESSGKILWVCQQILGFLGKLVTGNASVKMLGGPIFIAKMAGETARWGMDSLLNFMAFISVNLFIVSLLPIPVLDGGQIVYFLIEAVRGKPLSVRQRTIAQQVGFIMLMIITAFVVLNDIMRLRQ